MFSAASVISNGLWYSGTSKRNTCDMRRPVRSAGCGQHGVNQLVGVQAALHEHLDIAAGGQLGRLFGSRMAVRHVDDFNTGQINAGLCGHMANTHFGTNQHRNDQAVAGRVHGAAERAFVARVHHGAAHGFQAFAQRQQVIEARFAGQTTGFAGRTHAWAGALWWWAPAPWPHRCSTRSPRWLTTWQSSSTTVVWRHPLPSRSRSRSACHRRAPV